VQVDVTELVIDSFVRVSELTAPENTELVYGGDFNVLTVAGKRGDKEDEEAEEEAEA
jgi:hypothetical protein